MRKFSLILLFLSPWVLAKPFPQLRPFLWIEHGLHVAYLHRNHLPMVDLRLLAPAGSGYDGLTAGIAYLTNHMLDQGTATLNQEDIARKFEAVGAHYTDGLGNDMAVVGLRTLTNEAYLTQALDTWIALLQDPTFPDTSIKLLQSRMRLLQKKDQETAAALASLKFNQALYDKHPYAHPAYASLEDRLSFTTQSLHTFYHQHYRRDRCWLIIVGDLPLAKAKLIAMRVAKALPEVKEGMETQVLSATTQQNQQDIKVPFLSEQSTLILGQLGIDPKAAHRLDLQVGAYILGGGMTSLLFENVRGRHGLTYAISSGFTPYAMRGPFMIQAQTKAGNSEKAKKLILETVTNFIKEGPTTTQLLFAKAQMKSAFLTNISTNEGLLSALSYQCFYDLPLDQLSTYLDRLDKITSKSVQNSIKDTLHPDDWIMVEVGQP